MVRSFLKFAFLLCCIRYAGLAGSYSGGNWNGPLRHGRICNFRGLSKELMEPSGTDREMPVSSS